MDRELMLRHFETKYENPIGEIVRDDPEYKAVNEQFFIKSEEFCQKNLLSHKWGVTYV